jgi:hypothetical protein
MRRKSCAHFVQNSPRKLARLFTRRDFLCIDGELAELSTGQPMGAANLTYVFLVSTAPTASTTLYSTEKRVDCSRLRRHSFCARG